MMKVNLKASLAQRKKLYLAAKNAYYNSPTGKVLMSDEDFDALEDSIKEDDPEWSGLKKTGVKVKKKEVPLPEKMPSLEKRKPNNIQDWLDRGEASNIEVSEKLDGTSIQIVYNNKYPVACYTRGTGVRGGDISFILPHLNIPKKINFSGTFIGRFEGIFTKTAFKKYQNDESFRMARGAASGLLNRVGGGKPHPAMKDLRCVFLMCLKPWLTPSKGFKLGKKLGFKLVPHKSIPASKITPQNLESLLAKRKKKSLYEIDGLVLAWDKANPRPTEEKPKWATAFKVDVSEKDAPTTKVEKVVWKVSKHGVLFPVVHITPTKIAGSTVRKASANNARWMIDRGIGPGAIVKLVKGGEIIPKIIAVVKKAKFEPPKGFGKFAWDSHKTNLVLTNPKDSEDARIRQTTAFFKKLGTDWIAETTIRQFYENGLDSAKKILAVTPKRLMQVPGFKAVKAQKVYDQIQALLKRGALMPMLMEASGRFPKGLGTKRFAKIMKQYPNILKFASMPKKEVLEKVRNIPSFSGVTADMFAEGIGSFKSWLDKIGIKVTKPEKVKVSSNKLKGLGVTQTGYRSKEEDEIIQKNGGEKVDWGSRTNILLYSPSGKESTKIQKAKDKGIPVMTWDKFAKKYGL